MGNKQNKLLTSITESFRTIFKDDKDVYSGNRIISIGNGITFPQFCRLLESYTDSIPSEVINIIGDYICIYNLQGILVSEFPICAERPLSSQNHTAYCITSPSGVIFVSDSSSREVRRFNYSGEILPSFHTTPITYYKVNNSNFVTIPCPYTGPLSIYNVPYNITLDRDENLYITDYHNDIVIKYNKFGELASPKSIIGLDKDIKHPVAITTDKDKELIYVSSACQCKQADLFEIKSFKPNGEPVDTFHVPNQVLNLSVYNNNIIRLYRSETINYITLYFSIISLPLSNSSQIPINEIGNLYVADRIKNSVGIFKAENLNHIKTVKLHDSKGKTITPTTISVDEQGHLIVVSCTENKVFIYR